MIYFKFLLYFKKQDVVSFPHAFSGNLFEKYSRWSNRSLKKNPVLQILEPKKLDYFIDSCSRASGNDDKLKLLRELLISYSSES